jgi:glycosyltransferase involved in cell wall biosynthesis
MHPLRRASIQVLCFAADSIIFVSPREHTAYLNSRIGRLAAKLGQRTKIIPIGVNLNFFEIDPDSIIAQRNRQQEERGLDAFSIASFGFLYSAKRPEFLLEVVASLRNKGRNVWLDFFGEPPLGGSEYVKDLKSLSSRLGISDRVIFHGYVADERFLQSSLMCADLLSQFYDDGLSARRGSFWYAYSLGCKIVSHEPDHAAEFSALGLPDPAADQHVLLTRLADSAEETAEKILSTVTSPWITPKLRKAPISWDDIAEAHISTYISQ